MPYRARLIADPQSDQTLFNDIQVWCDTVHPYGITGSAIRYVMRKITVTKIEDVEMVLSKIVSNKQNIWAACIVADGLFISILYPSLLVPENIPVPLSPGLINEEVYHVLLLAFNGFVSFTAFLALIHMMVCIILYAGTSFILDVEDMCWFLMRFHRCISFINLSGVPMGYGLVISVMLSQTIIVGPSRAAPTIILGILAMIVMLTLYIWLKRRFFYLFKNVKGPWSRKLGNLFNDIQLWSDTVHSYGFTGFAIRYVMQKITITKKEDVEMVLSKIIGKIQNLWAVEIIADGLFISILYPSLLIPENVPVPLSPGLINEEVYQVLLLVFNGFVSFSAFLTLTHLMVIIILYAGTSFILDVEDMCWFLMRFHRCLSFINLSFLPLVYGLIMSVMLSQTIIVGPSRASPTVTFGIMAIIFMLVSYIWLRRRFFYLFKNVKGPWSRKLGNYSEKVENYNMQSLRRNKKSEKKSVSSYKPIDEFMDEPVVATAVELVENQRTKGAIFGNSLEPPDELSMYSV